MRLCRFWTADILATVGRVSWQQSVCEEDIPIPDIPNDGIMVTTKSIWDRGDPEDGEDTCRDLILDRKDTYRRWSFLSLRQFPWQQSREIKLSQQDCNHSLQSCWLNSCDRCFSSFRTLYVNRSDQINTNRRVI